MEANIDKEIECAFESLGSSEGRHSSDEDQHSNLDTLNRSRNDDTTYNDKTMTSRQHLYVKNNTSEQDDEQVDHY